jgi:hypothetical protein
VRCDSYFGPDRRRHSEADYTGPGAVPMICKIAEVR